MCIPLWFIYCTFPPSCVNVAVYHQNSHLKPKKVGIPEMQYYHKPSYLRYFILYLFLETWKSYCLCLIFSFFQANEGCAISLNRTVVFCTYDAVHCTLSHQCMPVGSCPPKQAFCFLLWISWWIHSCFCLIKANSCNMQELWPLNKNNCTNTVLLLVSVKFLVRWLLCIEVLPVD